MKITKESTIRLWASHGIKDFFISFEFEDNNKWHESSTFLCHQGLEKISKAYLLATRAAEYENLRAEVAFNKINKIAKEFGHAIDRIICQLILSNVLTSEDISQQIGGYSGRELIDILEKSYIESRYPVPNPTYKKYPIVHKGKHKIYADPIRETAPIQYARRLASAIMKKIETDFSMTISKDKISNKIDDKEWERFCNIFWGL